MIEDNNNNNISRVIAELSKVVPNDYLAHGFVLVYPRSQYHLQWYTSLVASAMNKSNPLLDFRTDNDKAGDALGIMCRELMKMGSTTLYDFILFLVESYCRNINGKVDVKELRDSLRSIGISDFSALNQYAKDESLVIFISDVSDWHGINEAINQINKDCSLANTEIEYQNIGNSCRNLVISVAQIVFNPDIHGNTNKDGKALSKTDAIGMLSNYFTYKFSGSNNELYRKYAKAANDLANMLTHKRNATKMDMLITVSATLSLVNLIGVIEGKFK